MNDLMEIVETLSKRVSAAKTELDVNVGRRDTLRGNLASERKKMEKEEEKRDLYKKSREFLTAVLEGTQHVIEDTFSELTTSGVSGIFGEDQSLRFKFVPTSKGVDVQIRVIKPSPEDDGEVIEINPKNAEGGGMMDIIGIGLRASLLELYHPVQDGPLVLDEVCKYLADDDTLEAAGEFLQKLQRESGRQIIMITHKSGLSQFADRVFEFRPGPNSTVRIDQWDDE